MLKKKTMMAQGRAGQGRDRGEGGVEEAQQFVMSVSIYVSLTAADLNVRSIVHLHYYNVIIT